MNNANTTWLNPESLTVRLPEITIPRLGVIDRAQWYVDVVTPDYDIKTEPRVDLQAPLSTDAFGGFGEAVLAAASTPQYATSANVMPAYTPPEALTEVHDDPAVRQEALEERYRIDLKDDNTDLDNAYWDANILNTAAPAPAPAALSDAPATEPPFDPLANWGIEHKPAPAPAAAIEDVPRLEFPAHTGPEAVTHQLPAEYAHQTAANVTQPVVITPVTAEQGFWSTTNPEQPVPESAEAREYRQRVEAARAKLASLHSAQPVQINPTQHLVGV